MHLASVVGIKGRSRRPLANPAPLVNFFSPVVPHTHMHHTPLSSHVSVASFSALPLPFLCPSSAPLCPPHAPNKLITPNNTPLASLFSHHLLSDAPSFVL